MPSRRILHILAVAVLLLSGCATFDRQNLHRIGIVNLFPDSVATSEASSFFAFPKGNDLSLPGVHDLIGREAKSALESQGFQVALVPIDPDLFWAQAEAINNKKSHILAPGQPHWDSIFEALQAETRSGKINTSDLDVIILIGPRTSEGEAHFLGQRGSGVTVFHVQDRPLFGAAFNLCSAAYNAKTLAHVPGVRLFVYGSIGGRKGFQIDGVTNLKTLLDEQHRSQLFELLRPGLHDAFSQILR